MNRTAVWIVLGLLVAAHVMFAVSFNPTGTSQDLIDTTAKLALALACGGVIISQPALAAAVAVLWPAHWVLRLLAGLGLLLVMVFATLLGEAQNSSVEFSSAVLPVFEFLFLVALLWPLAWLRGWRMEARGDGDGQPPRQLSVRGLLIVMAIAGSIFAMGRFVLSPIFFVADLEEELAWAAVTGLLLAGLLLPMVPLLPLLLSDGNRRWPLIATVVTVAATFLFVLTAMMGQPLDRDAVMLIACAGLAAYASVTLSLLVVRWCGFRLVRESKGAGI